MNRTIEFYRPNMPYGFFSNFSRHPIRLGGKVWATSEHYFQAQKFAGTEHEEFARLAPTPREAAQIGRDRSRPLRPDWESVKDNIMRQAVRAKFTQHPELGAELLATADVQIVEHTTKDGYWGDGGDGSGKNMLGRILMEIRAELRSQGIARNP
jgi:N-glycosidase YbiA